MLKLDALDLKDVNLIEVVLTQLHDAGVTDIRLAQQMVH